MPAGPGARTLSRDFKDVRRHKHVAVGHGFNGWVGLGIGFGLGLLVAFGVHLHYSRQLAASTVPVPSPDAAPASSVATDDPGDDAGTPAVDLAAATDYGFYDMLPKQEVEVPDPARDRARVGKAAKPPLPRGDVVLQAGSFKQQMQAEKLVAKLAYMGINARVQRTPVDDETWYRVRIGPIETVEELEAVRAKLLEAEITATAVTPVEETPPP
jgi:cell division protein FtsN